MNLIRKFLPILLIMGALGGGYVLMSSKPTPQRKPAPKIIPQVQAMQIEVGSIPIIIDTIGTIIASQEIDITSKVSGTVESLTTGFQPGSVVKKDDVLLQLDKIDYEVALKKVQANFAKSKADYQLEQGQQSIAQSEYKKIKEIMPNISSSEINTNLTLRKPQLEQAKANMAISQADLDDAKLDLSHTTIKAPFDALITARSVSTGQHVSTNQTLGHLVAIDEYWVDVTLAVETLYNNKILSHDAKGLPVTVVTKANEEWKGELIQTVNVLTSGSRMGKLLVSVDDPLSLEQNMGKTPLLMGDQVQILLETGIFDNTIAVPRASVKNGDTLWLIEDNKLKSVKVNILWKDSNLSYVDATNIPKTSAILVSDLTNPVENLEVRPVFIDPDTGDIIENATNQAPQSSEKGQNQKGQGRKQAETTVEENNNG